MAPTKQCPSCGTVGMRVGEVHTQLNCVSKAFIPEGREKPTKVDVEHPFDCPVEWICPQCSNRWPATVESHN